LGDELDFDFPALRAVMQHRLLTFTAWVSSTLRLTPSERRVLSLRLEGLRPRQIAARLGVTEGTIKKHASNLCQKAGTDHVDELVGFICLAGYGLVDLRRLITPPDARSPGGGRRGDG
jgi:DNA-binding CsgD family transcriptional regulator